jgi:hypothetical protein
MSVSLILLPIGLLAAAAAGGVAADASRPAADRAEQAAAAPAVRVRTRMKDVGLLGAALTLLGAVDVTTGEADVSGTVGDAVVTMRRTDQGVWEAHVAGAAGQEIGERDAVALVRALDGAYAAMVQQAVARKIRERADSAGFELTSEHVERDDTLTMVLTVKDHA